MGHARYLVPLIALSLRAGRCVDRVGLGPVLTLSVTIFALASVAAALAPSTSWLVLARVGKGVAGALLLAAAPALAATAVRTTARGRAMAVVATLAPLTYLAVFAVQFLTPFFLREGLAATAGVIGATILANPAATAVMAPSPGGPPPRADQEVPRCPRDGTCSRSSSTTHASEGADAPERRRALRLGASIPFPRW